ncbi:hypothetical protein FI667_g3190, partial [Globisporangium splendens]
MLSASLELAEASFDHVFDSVVRLAERTIPGVHSFLSWEPKDANLGPMLHDWPVLLTVKKLHSRALLRAFPAAPAA